MGVHRFQLVGHGPPALAELGEVLAGLKDDDPLAAVTVAVPHPWAGLSLRRALAARHGLVNVQFLVLPRIAELLGAPVLAAGGGRPRTATVTRAAARAVLRDAPGEVLGRVADHPATEAAVVRLVDELAAVGVEGRRRLAATSPRTGDLVGLAERVLDAAGGRYDRHDLTRAATRAVSEGHRAVSELGHLVVHLPDRLTPAEVQLIGALAGAGRVSVLLGLTGDEAADAPVRSLVSRLEPALGAPHLGEPPSPPTAQRLVTTTDADEEVRAALRSVVARWERGVPLERMAVAYPTPEPYARLLHEQAAAAGLPIAGTATSTLATSVPGRTLLAGLSLIEGGLSRDGLISWLAAAPTRDLDGERIPTARWDVLTRRAGIVTGDVDLWVRHLDAERRRLDEDAARQLRTNPDADPTVLAERTARDRAEIDRMLRFVTWVDDELRALEGLGSWDAMVSSSLGLLRTVLGRESRWGTWPERQAAAGDAVIEALERLRALDEVEPAPSAQAFRRALAAELDTGHGRSGDFGRGLLVAPLRHVVGLDLDVVAVVGLAEGTLPGRTSDDALLPDAARAGAEVDLPRRADAVVEQHHRLLAAMAAGPERILLMPRGDLRQGRDRLPSRWLLASATALAGRPVTTEEFARLDHPAIEVVPSFTGGLTRTEHHVSLEERDLADLARWTGGDRTASSHALVAELPALARALEVVDARRRGGFGRFTGRVTGVDIPTFRRGSALSPTALERWAACPRRYFFAQVLRLRDEERPEVIDRITPRDRGSLVHEALDRFVSEVIDGGGKAPGEAWTTEERARLHELLDEHAAEFEEKGLTGRRVLWSLDRDALHREVERFLDEDDQLRALRRSAPIAAELAFGPDAPVEAHLDLPGGRHVTFKGFADRVDRTEDGGLLVLDYKTGSASKEVKEIAKGDDVVVRGEKLQLPVYALAARAAYPDATGPVYTGYWHISERGRFGLHGYTVTEETDARFVEALTTIADGIEGGIFPGRPGPPSSRAGHAFDKCGYCDFDRVCGRDRAEEWEHVRLAPEMRPLLALADELDDDDSGETEGGTGAATEGAGA